ncbi:MAG TPA: hypothetical protein VGS98_15690 [Thermoanaerobaculia bacterium]|jgi:hypothetical protein|nr:hypothetical protein [Thermoanaerobaculia bacterium]
MLIHGAWLTPRGWDLWRERYEARGKSGDATPRTPLRAASAG